MRHLIFFFIFCSTSTIMGQTDRNESIFWDIIDYKLFPDRCTEVAYVKTVDFKMLSYHINNFKKETKRIYYGHKTNKLDSIIFSKKEKEYIISELSQLADFSWNLEDEKELIPVENSELISFLKKDKNRELKIISKPVFIRNGEIACVFSIHLCCGDFFGHASLALYKKPANKWVRWIALSHGDF